MIGQQIYTLIYNAGSNSPSFKVDESLLKYILSYKTSIEFAFTLYYPLAFGIGLTSLELLLVR